MTVQRLTFLPLKLKKEKMAAEAPGPQDKWDYKNQREFLEEAVR